MILDEDKIEKILDELSYADLIVLEQYLNNKIKNCDFSEAFLGDDEEITRATKEYYMDYTTVYYKVHHFLERKIKFDFQMLGIY